MTTPRILTSAVLALTAPLFAMPAGATSPAEPAAETGRTVWRTADPQEARATYGDVQRLRIGLERKRVEVRMRFWRGRDEFYADLFDIDVDTGGGPDAEFRIYWDSYVPRRLAIYRYESRRVCVVHTARTPQRFFSAHLPVRCLTARGKGRPDRVRFRVANKAEDPLFSAADIVPGGVWRGEGTRPWGPWLTTG